MELSNIFESEHEENWRIVFAQYTELYRQSPSIDVAMHFAFFCWYPAAETTVFLLSRWAAILSIY